MIINLCVHLILTIFPLRETIVICNILYQGHLSPLQILEAVFIKFAMDSVEFSFNSMMYRPIDGIAMGGSLALLLDFMSRGCWLI